MGKAVGWPVCVFFSSSFSPDEAQHADSIDQALIVYHVCDTRRGQCPSPLHIAGDATLPARDAAPEIAIRVLRLVGLAGSARSVAVEGGAVGAWTSRVKLRKASFR